MTKKSPKKVMRPDTMPQKLPVSMKFMKSKTLDEEMDYQYHQFMMDTFGGPKRFYETPKYKTSISQFIEDPAPVEESIETARLKLDLEPRKLTTYTKKTVSIENLI